jgi:tRNA threonylcarbamoyladenosine biosynthesis protein TsaE
MQITYHLASENHTVDLGKKLAKVLGKPLIIGFTGVIGMGKTSLIRAMLQARGVESAIKSPTFNLVETYTTAFATFHHFDLYRLNSEHALEDLGFRDYLSADTITCIEWPKNAPQLTAFIDLMVEFSFDKTKMGRDVQLVAHSKLGEQCLERLKES